MPKDLKIGMFLGLVLAIAAVLWLATRPSLSLKSRMLQSQNTQPQQQTAEQQRSMTSLPASPSSPSARQNQPNNYEFIPGKSPRTDMPRVHTVLKGQTLSTISYQYYGSENQWKKIYTANRGKIKDPNKLKPGTKLLIPN